MSAVKEEARRLAEDAAWDEMLNQLYVKAKTTRALAAVEAGISHEERSGSSCRRDDSRGPSAS